MPNMTTPLPWPDLDRVYLGGDGLYEYQRARAEAAISRLRLVMQTLDALVTTLPSGSNRFLVAKTIEVVGPLPDTDAP